MATLHAAATETLTCLADRSLATATANSLLTFATSQQQQQQPAVCRQHCLAVTHVQQCFNWDCGLACALMVLKTLGVSSLDLSTLQTLCSTTSVWTVDLAHLLRHFGLDVTLATIMVGANPSYYHEDFYMEHMAEDQFRVTQLFKEAEQAGIVIQQKSIPLKKLQESMLCGHYVVLCGYNADTDAFLVQDPAAGCCHISVPSATLEYARKAWGTDEDLLIVPLNQRRVPTASVHEVQVYGRCT